MHGLEAMILANAKHVQSCDQQRLKTNKQIKFIYSFIIEETESRITRKCANEIYRLLPLRYICTRNV